MVSKDSVKVKKLQTVILKTLTVDSTAKSKFVSKDVHESIDPELNINKI